MAVEGGMKCVKFLLFTFNVVFSLYGLAIIMVGVLVGLGVFPDIDPEVYSRSAIGCLIIGIVTLLVAFFGCCGAWKENYCMVATFVTLQTLYLIAEILLIVGVLVIFHKLLDHGLQDMVREYKTKEEFKYLMDDIQQKSYCCGAVNSSDWVNFQTDGMSVPDSCCWNVTTDCGAGAMIDFYKIYPEGCKTALEHMHKGVMSQFGVPALAIAFIEVLDIVLACTLLYGIRRGYSIVEVQKNHFHS